MSEDSVPMCKRCGGEMVWIECEVCGGEGIDGHDCGEDCCCCMDPEPNLRCHYCMGRGRWLMCANSEAWCKTHPLTEAQP